MLLATLYAGQMIASRERSSAAGPPETISELMLQYVDEVNRNARPATDPDDRTIKNDLKAIAWECVQSAFHPLPREA